VEGDSGTLEAEGMPKLGRDHVFQAWIVDEGATKPRPSTLFVPRRGGTATASISGLEDAAQVMVTREPRGGSAQPTSAPLLRARLS